MKLKFFIVLIVFLAIVAAPARPQQAQGPLSGDQVMVLVKAGMTTPAVVRLIQDRGINFDLTDDYLEALRKAGAQAEVIQALRTTRPAPLSSDQVLALLAAGVPSKHAAVLVKAHGIDFLADNGYLEALRLAGADDALIAALREASAAVVVETVVVTSPGAGVYCDGAFQGRASAQGELAFKEPPGTHQLRVSLDGMKDFAQSVTLVARQPARIEARLEATAAELVVVTSPGADVYLDGELRGRVGAQGELTMKASLGTRTLRIRLSGRKDFEGSVTLVSQQTTRIPAQLENVSPPESPKPSAIPVDWTTKAVSLRGRIGERFVYICPPRGRLSSFVWGTGLYTDDSPVCTAAVHAGLLTLGQGGKVTIEIRPGAGSYQGSRQNGVASRNYRSWGGSYVFVP